MAKYKALTVLLAAILAVCLQGSGTALAAPAGGLAGSNVASSSGINGTVISVGTVSGNTLTVTLAGGSGGIINWSSLGVGSGETLRFTFSGSSDNAAVLNRVTGSSLSQIAGTISSNGKVFLVNPNGIVFADGAAINTASFVASTLSVSDSAFTSYATGASSSLLLNAGTGTIQVNGQVGIDSSSAALIASTVTVAPGITFTGPRATQTSAGANSVSFSDGAISIIPAITSTSPPAIQAQLVNTAQVVLPGATTPFVPTPLSVLAVTNGANLITFSSPASTTTSSTAAPQTVTTTDTGSALLPAIASGSTSPGGTSTGTATLTGTGSASGGTSTGSVPPLVGSGDRAMTVVAQPPPVVPVNHAQPLPPRVTTSLSPGLVDHFQPSSPPPPNGTPGIVTNFSSSGNSNGW
ncbi:MAG: filamentous hemagglutinin N-terminal domain-containing protein [Negativicutes bacterium]|nr:filamentous hemagglutinin N-terminal domain-containing protein [Negativicutes bacterium]